MVLVNTSVCEAAVFAKLIPFRHPKCGLCLWVRDEEEEVSEEGGGGGKENKNKTNEKKQGNNKHYTESHCQSVSDPQWKKMGRYQSTNKTQTPNKTFLLLMLLYSIGAIQIFPNNSDGSFITRFEDKTLKVVRKN